jgi:3-oxoacyl-[acyl-carrier protein] reductase
VLDFTGRVVMVTGASGGIGSGIARRFGQAGATVAVHYHRDRAGAEAVRASIGGASFCVAADLAAAGGAAALAEEVAERAGGMDTWISNAGLQPVQALRDMTRAEFDEVMAANVGSVFDGTAAAAVHLRAGGFGSIVNIASIEGIQPASGHSHYSASKAAVLAHTRAAALELGGSGIRVNAVAPGLIARPGIAEAWPEGVARWEAAAPLHRLGTPEDVADACVFLASPLARWITGAVLVVDGGVLSRPTW